MISKQEKSRRAVRLQLPEGLVSVEKAYPTVYVDTRGIDIGDSEFQETINLALYDALCKVHDGPVGKQTLIKVHVGEPKCHTRTMPEFAASSAMFLKNRGAEAVVAGDTTVAYSGPRGYKENTHDDCSEYLSLAKSHGWDSDGPLRVPFVILDRPATSRRGGFEFAHEEQIAQIEGINRYRDFFISGGFHAADFTINNPHLTLHTLSGVAGCVKGVAMGCSAYTGKLRMHQYLFPRFDSDSCQGCGSCVENCPEGALSLDRGQAIPTVDTDLCIGCGECKTVCESDGVELIGREITDWTKGFDTFSIRLADYMMGLMLGKWAKTIHVLHMYKITEKCDCLDVKQKPMIQDHLGFLVGKNPFAIDKIAAGMFEDALLAEGVDYDSAAIKSARITAQYVRNQYGILDESSIETISINENEKRSMNA